VTASWLKGSPTKDDRRLLQGDFSDRRPGPFVQTPVSRLLESAAAADIVNGETDLTHAVKGRLRSLYHYRSQCLTNGLDLV
jgi:hypothetical protein